MVKRYGNLWDELISPENFKKAYFKAVKGKHRKYPVEKFKENLEQNLESVRQLVLTKQFKTSPYSEKRIFEPKERTIYILPFNPDRIVQHALMNILSPIFEKLFIADSFACRKGYGIHRGSQRTMEFVRRNDYVLKCDISRFYPSVDHDILLSIIKRKIKDKDVLWLIEDIIRSFPGNKNVPIGNFCSQWFGNFYMNELDKYVKSTLHIKDYIRYCDDFCLFHNDKEILKNAREKIKDFLSDKLALKYSKSEIFPVTQGVDFLGYRHFKKYILLRKSTSKRVKKRLLRLPEMFKKGKIRFETYRSSVGSTNGWLKWANTFNFRKKLRISVLVNFLKEYQINARHNAGYNER